MTRHFDRWAAPHWAAVAAVSGAMVGCFGVNEARSLASARAALEANEVPAARLALKSLLQAKPSSGEARFLLGKLMHDQGELPQAEAELRRALEAGYAANQVVPLLADTLLSLGKGNLLIQQFSQATLPDAAADAALKTTLATAKAASGDFNGAGALVDEALLQVADYAPALLLRAKLSASAGDRLGVTSRAAPLLAIR